MKKTGFLFSLLFLLITVSHAAEAKRFGMGKSYGYSKQVAPKQYGQKAPAQKPSAPAAAGNAVKKPATGASRWLGPLAGLAAGGLLAAMLFGDGFQGIQLLDILLLALVAFLLFKLFVRRRQTQPTYAGQEYQAGSQPDRFEAETHHRESRAPTVSPAQSQGGSIIGSGLSSEATAVHAAPEWFDADGFLEQAKHHFVAVQQAWDHMDLATLREYCTPELFAALEAEMAGMQPGENHTQVDTLYAEMADTALEGEYLMVSVYFSGFIIEEQNAQAHAFNEIWHIRRLAAGEGAWQIAGIQQS